MTNDFDIDVASLKRAVDLMAAGREFRRPDFTPAMPEAGLGTEATMQLLAPYVLGGAAPLGSPISFAHMDPPTPWISWAIALWNASLNQNLLHPATSPVAREAEEQVVQWLAPFFCMQGGHMTPGSTVANLTALWAARELAGVTEVVAGEGAHLSILKAARVLGLHYRTAPSFAWGSLRPDALDGNLERTALVLTAGTTSTGAIDPLSLAGRAAWTHVDAAWAGPLRLSPMYAACLDGIERADSVAVSAHKWLFQPKEAGIVLFRDVGAAHRAISFGGAYLATPNVGLLGSHGASAIPLLATILAWGRIGLAKRIERCMELACRFGEFVAADHRLDLLRRPESGIVVWRPVFGSLAADLVGRLPSEAVSSTFLGGEMWLRNVAANPNANLEALTSVIQSALGAIA